jgi:hypothetical protein
MGFDLADLVDITTGRSRTNIPATGQRRYLEGIQAGKIQSKLVMISAKIIPLTTC